MLETIQDRINKFLKLLERGEVYWVGNLSSEKFFYRDGKFVHSVEDVREQWTDEKVFPTVSEFVAYLLKNPPSNMDNWIKRFG